MSCVADQLDFSTPPAAPTVTLRDLRAYLDTIPGDAAADVQLVEGLRWFGFDAVADMMAVPPQVARDRFFALTRPFAAYGWQGKRTVSIDGQTMLLAELKRRAA